MNIAIVDDQKEYLTVIEKIIVSNTTKQQIRKYNNGYDFLKEANTFDIVFLDIDMPYLDGIEMVKLLSDITIEIVFITSYKERMIEAFGKNVIGFVLKEDMNIGIVKILNAFDKRKPSIKIKTKYKEAKIYLEEIQYIDYSLRDITFHLLNQDNMVMKEMSLKNILLQLSNGFILINRTTIVNIHHVIQYKNGYVFLKNKKLSVSRRNAKDLQIQLFERSIAYARSTK
jgi:DNA-binding LytR/AlgR family response regulator